MPSSHVSAIFPAHHPRRRKSRFLHLREGLVYRPTCIRGASCNLLRHQTYSSIMSSHNNIQTRTLNDEFPSALCRCSMPDLKELSLYSEHACYVVGPEVKPTDSSPFFVLYGAQSATASIFLPYQCHFRRSKSFGNSCPRRRTKVTITITSTTQAAPSQDSQKLIRSGTGFLFLPHELCTMFFRKRLL